ncbi:MAG TPA: hypothetical protein VFU15_09350 [Bacteroidia bacterium]|nr:hypothetical protein [Bacteroidia bacterium]
MKTVLHIFLLLASAVSCRQQVAPAGTLTGKWSHEHEEKLFDGPWGNAREHADLILNADSTFSLLIEWAGSDFPGEYNGKWSLHEDRIILHDTTANFHGENDLTFHVRRNGTLLWQNERDRVFEKAKK